MKQTETELLNEISRDNMLETVERFNELFRYSGTEDGEKAAGYLKEKLDSYGVPYELCEYEGFFSKPVSAAVTVEGKEYRLVGDVYSEEADGLTGELYYDVPCREKKRTQRQESKRFMAFSGKIVLTWDGKGDFARKALDAGALAVLHICGTKGGYIHHSNIGRVWGTPGLDEAVYMRFLPSAGIGREDGEELIGLLAKGKREAVLSIKMDTGIRKSTMVIADISGTSESFVLVSGHYDSWYEGITDNAVSDAILLEYARILNKRRGLLRRGIRIAWWSGHSDGRFSGSAWYCDSHYGQLKKHCVAHINLDLTGCRNAEQIVARTAGTEGLDFTGKLIEKYTGKRPDAYVPMIRGADQSFWGADIPITIMLKYEPEKDRRLSDCPSGGPWWHTPEDTLDKLDETIMMRDAGINLELIKAIEGAEILPVNIPEFTRDMDERLNRILDALTKDFDGREIREVWQRAKKSLTAFEGMTEKGLAEDIDIKAVVGKALHLFYCRKDAYTHDCGCPFGVFADIAQFGGITRDNTEREYYLMALTDFMRYKNRLCNGLEEMITYIEGMTPRR